MDDCSVLRNYQQIAKSVGRYFVRLRAIRQIQEWARQRARHTMNSDALKKIYNHNWLLFVDLVAQMSEAQQKTCTENNREYCKLGQRFPSHDQVVSHFFPIIFAAFLDLYRSIAKMIVGKPLSPQVLFHLQLLRMIRLKLTHLAVLIQQNRSEDGEVDVLNCVSTTCSDVRKAHDRIAETMHENVMSVITIQTLVRRGVVIRRLDKKSYSHHYPAYAAGLAANYDKICTFTKGATELLSQSKAVKTEKAKLVFKELHKFLDVLEHKSTELWEQEGWCHPVRRLVRETDRVKAFCDEFSKKQEEARRLEQEQRDRKQKQEHDRIASQKENEKAIAATKALARLEDEKKQVEQAEQQRLLKQQEIAEKEKEKAIAAEKEKAERVLAATRRAELTKQKEEERKAAVLANQAKNKASGGKAAGGGKK
jgi:hypothetical protein